MMKHSQNFYPLSAMQQGILFHVLYAPESRAYFQQVAYNLEGDLDDESFERAWRHVFERHDVLRTSFLWDGLKEPVQVMHEELHLPFERRDFRALTSDERRAQLESLLQADRERGFDLSAPPLMRCTMVRLADQSREFVWSYHHLLLDGWSLSPLLKEVLACYKDYSAGNVPQLKPARPFRDYIVWLRRQDVSGAETTWRKELNGFDAATPLGIERAVTTAPGEGPSHGGQSVRLSREVTGALRLFARRQRLTLNTIVQGAWAFILSRYSGDDDVLFGTVVSGRPATLPGVDSMIGLFTNVLPVRVQMPSGSSVVSFLKDMQAQQAELRQYEYTPLLKIREWSDVSRELPLFESIVVFENYPVDESLREPGHGFALRRARVFEQTHYPLTIVAVPGQELSLRIGYDRRRFDDEAIAGMLGHFQAVLAAITENPEASIFALSLLTAAERHCLAALNATWEDFSFEVCLHRLFEEQVERTPEAVAAVYEDEYLTYEELNRRANLLAHRLQELGVGPEVCVGVCVERSLKTLVALLAIFKAGGVYVPLDPAYPPAQLEFMLEDTRVPVLLTEQRLVGLLSGHGATLVIMDATQEETVPHRENNPSNAVTPGNLAFVMYTSGSTGRPKGVAVEQKQLLNRFQWMWKAYPFRNGEVACQRTTMNFSVSMWELLGPLLKGVRVVILPDETVKNPRRLIETLAAREVTRIVLVPSLLRMLMETDVDLQSRLPKLELWSVCGEPLTADLYRQFRRRLPDAILLNQYGASEVNDVCWFETGARTEELPTVPIGRPISNVGLYILDRHLRQTPPGVPGGLYVSSINPARGYFNSPALTAERFIPNPFSTEPGARLYKTGDRARLLPDGNVQHLGRLDHQVKVRGHRIELHGVETVLGQHPSVRQVLVSATETEPGMNSLTAYVVPAVQPAPTVVELRDFLRERLAAYMIPATFVFLDAFPRTPNGKLDRRALPPPGASRPELAHAFVPPSSPVEEVLSQTWANVLHLSRVGIHDNFFDLGGDSLQATRIVSAVSKSLGVELPLRDFFEHPTVAELARAVTELKELQKDTGERELLLMLEGLSDAEVEAELMKRTTGGM